MTNARWRPEPGGPHRAGDHFGDDEVTDALVVTYRLDGSPRARVSAYFGVIKPASSGRYAPVSEVSCELLDATGQDVADEVTVDGHAFLLDYSDLASAKEDMAQAAQEWQATTWRAEDFFDGTTLP